MKIKDLKEIIKDLPDEMPFVLVDISTDDPYEGNYSIHKDSFEQIELTTDVEDLDAPKVQGLALTFKNNMNEKPL